MGSCKMSRFKFGLKIVAGVCAVISALLVIPFCPAFNNLVINMSSKYQNLEKAVNVLSDMSLQQFKNTKLNASKLLQRSDVGFNEMLSLINNKIPLININAISGIIIVKPDTYIAIGPIEATPRLSLCVVINNTINGISVMFKNDLKSWVESEKQSDLQRLSFWVLLGAVGIDLVADFDITKEQLERFCRRLKGAPIASNQGSM
jgi:hypothetical protein